MTWFKRSSNSKSNTSVIKLHSLHSLFIYNISFVLPNIIVKGKKQIQSLPILQISKMKLRMVKEFAFSCKASIRADI